MSEPVRRPAADRRYPPPGRSALAELQSPRLLTFLFAIALTLTDLQGRTIRTFRRQRNSEWQPGSGLFTVHSISGSKALISQGGQLRGTFTLGVRYVLLDLKSGKCVDLDLKSDLAKYGRDSGQIYLVDASGTLVFVTLSLAEAKDSGAIRNSASVPEIWVRSSRGLYSKVASSAHYECVRNGEVIYWEPTTRAFMAFSIANQQTRRAPEFKVHGFEDVTQGVIMSSDHRGLQLGEKVAGQWNYRPLDLKPEAIP